MSWGAHGPGPVSGAYDQGHYAHQPQQGYGPPQQQSGCLELEISFMFLQFVLYLFTPTVVVDGYPQKRPWGRHFIELPPGNHHIHVSFPYLFTSKCGPAEGMIPIYPGTLTRVKYESPFFMFSNGTMNMLGHAPLQPPMLGR